MKTLTFMQCQEPLEISIKQYEKCSIVNRQMVSTSVNA